jgi:predicted TIM-barrel fold metal-dependent hydrolase
MEAIAVPPALQRLSGRIIDVDSHEMMPAQEWVRHFGPEVRAFAEACAADDPQDKNTPWQPGYSGDIQPVGPDIGDVKGARAPGATNPERRLEVMDAMGVRRQLMFPSGVGLYGFAAVLGKVHPALKESGEDPQAVGKRWVELYNEWAIDAAKVSERIRPVLPVVGDTPEALYANALRLIDRGARALWLAAGPLPGGRSPAHPDLDRFWALLAESRTVATLHGGGEGRFLHTNEWKNAPAFQGYRSTAEFDFDPWSMSVYHLPSQNFVTTLIFGGVFERHPDLRFGVIEIGAQWVGPMMENIDLTYRAFQSPTAYRLPRKPSDYMRSNVRVSPLVYEEIDVWMERYPGVQDVLCFSTDYPHYEGGKSAMRRLHERVARLGEAAVDKFFVTNGELLTPDL